MAIYVRYLAVQALPPTAVATASAIVPRQLADAFLDGWEPVAMFQIALETRTVSEEDTATRRDVLHRNARTVLPGGWDLLAMTHVSMEKDSSTKSKRDGSADAALVILVRRFSSFVLEIHRLTMSAVMLFTLRYRCNCLKITENESIVVRHLWPACFCHLFAAFTSVLYCVMSFIRKENF